MVIADRTVTAQRPHDGEVPPSEVRTSLVIRVAGEAGEGIKKPGELLIQAAARAGIKEVLLPEHNRKDWAEVPEEVRAKMKVHFLRRISELLPLALEETKPVKAKKGAGR